MTAADHELVEGYFSLGDHGALLVRPGEALYQFLARQRGRTITIGLSEGSTRELSRLQR